MSDEAAAYQAHLTAGIFKVIAEAATLGPEGEARFFIMSDAALDVLTSTIALLVAKADRCSSPAKTRKFCDDLARQLQRKIAKARLSDEDFIRHVKMGALH